MFLLIFLIIFSSVKINIKEITAQNVRTQKLEYDFNIKIGLYLFNKLPIATISINKEKTKSIKKFKKIGNKQNLDILKYLKKLRIKIDSLKLDLCLGTEDAMHTSLLVAILGVAISTFLPKVSDLKSYRKINYKICPLYTGDNAFELKLSSIICVKMVHIISIIYIIWRKRRDEKYERASNRRAYAHSYE